MNENMMQALVDGLSAQLKAERSATQMTLGKMIAALEAMPPDAEVSGLGHAHSYRGYYSDLAFEPQKAKVKAADLLAECRKAMGRTFCGYKGGDFMMGDSTPMWVAHYGCCGVKLMAIKPDGELETAEDEL